MKKPTMVVLKTIIVGFFILQSNMQIKSSTRNIYTETFVLIIYLKRWIMMSNNTIDLLNIPIYQQMKRVVYIDRCMVKWAGMLLSEHS